MIIVPSNVGKKPAISFVNSYVGSTLASGVTSVSFTGIQVGDFLVAVGGNQQTSDPSFTSGWTKVVSYNASNDSGSRAGIIVYKVAQSTTESLTFTGSGSSSANYSGGIAFRNVTAIGGYNFRQSNGGPFTSVATPTLNLQITDGGSALFLASYISGANGITSAPNSMTVSNGMAYGLARSSWAGGNMTAASSVADMCGIVELVQ